MAELKIQKQFQAVRNLPFCYRCGEAFSDSDLTDHDHVPAKATFHLRDREPALKLRVHKDRCHAALSVDDRKLGQLIGLRRGERPNSIRDQALILERYGDAVAVTNLNIDQAIWRWVQGFHAALYHESLNSTQYTIRTPFPRADKNGRGFTLQPLHRQHEIFVETIKYNRLLKNVDQIVSNNGKLRYECVWCLADNQRDWLCIFGIDIYGWKDLGSHTKAIPARGCAGSYMLANGVVPNSATKHVPQGKIVTPNFDVLDPFGR